MQRANYRMDVLEEFRFIACFMTKCSVNVWMGESGLLSGEITWRLTFVSISADRSGFEFGLYSMLGQIRNEIFTITRSYYIRM